MSPNGRNAYGRLTHILSVKVTESTIMKFVSNYLIGGIVHAKTKCDALVTIAKLYDYPDYKIYWEGNTPYMLPFAQSRRVFKVYASHSKMGKALNAERKRYAV